MGTTYEAAVEVRHQYPAGPEWVFVGFFDLGGKVYDFADLLTGRGQPGEHGHVRMWPGDLSRWIKDYQEIDPMDFSDARYVLPPPEVAERLRGKIGPVMVEECRAFAQYVLELDRLGVDARVLVWGS